MRRDEDEIVSLESEAGVIATLIHYPEFYFHSENLLPNHFYDKSNRCIYTAIMNLAKKEIKTIDAFNIIEILNNDEATKKIANDLTLDNLQELIDMSDTLARTSVEEYKMLVLNIMDAAFRRDMLGVLRECEKLCKTDGQEEIQKRIYNEIDDLISQFSTVEEIPDFKDIVDDTWADIEAHQNGNSSGIPFKFPTLNEYVTIEPSELVVLGAPAKGAKSMFMLNEAVDILKQGKSVMYIDSELSSRLFLCRMISHLTGIDFHNLKSGNYPAEDKMKIDAALEWIKKQKLVHIYMPLFDQQTIFTSVKKISHRFGKLDVLIVDYIKSSGDTDAYATYAELGKLVDMIKNDICGSMNIAGLAAAQLTSTNKLADSAKISRNASTIMIMTDKTPEEIAEYGAECGNKKLQVQLNRNGMQHVTNEWIDLNFDGNKIMLTEAKQHIPYTPY